MNRLSAAFGRLLDALAMLAALMLLAMVAVITADILMRNINRAGVAWANEASEYALYAMSLLAAPWLLRRGQHVRIDLALTAAPARVAWLLEAAGDIAGFAVCVIMTRYGLQMALDSFRLGSLTIKTIVFPEWWLLAPLPACFLLLAIEFTFRFARLMRDPLERRADSIAVG